MIRTPQEFINEVRRRFGERLSDEIEEHGRTVMHFAEENNRLRDIVRRMSDALQGIMDAADGKGEGVLDEALLREAREAIGKDASP